MSLLGTMSIGIRAPIIRKGDDIVKITLDSISGAMKEYHLPIEDGDIIGITESALARSQGNYITIDQAAENIKNLFPHTEKLGIVFPILSRNRFVPILKAIARAFKNKSICMFLQHPKDEQGNRLTAEDFELDTWRSGKNYQKQFGTYIHPFTGIDYIKLYEQTIQTEGAHSEIYICQNPANIISYTKDILIASVHNRFAIKELIKKRVHIEKTNKLHCHTLDNICSSPTIEHGYNEQYGLLGSNLSNDETLKLFPRPTNELGLVYVFLIQDAFRQQHGCKIEVIIFGDGAYKDPETGIWELADPSVYADATPKLLNEPNEIKMKYIIDKYLVNGTEIEQVHKMQELMQQHSTDSQLRQGTTPRKIANLVGSLCDLTTGSGDKGTPFVLIKNYFKKYYD